MDVIIKLWPLWLVVIVCLVIFKPYIKGYIGEKTVSFFLQTLPSDYFVLNNIMLETERGTTQIDHIVVSRYGVFVIETKNYKGWIYGSDTSEKWTQVLFRQKHQFMNPIYQNYKHCKAINNLINNDKVNIVPIIAFSRKSTLKVNTQSNVVYFNQVRQVIRNYKEPTISSEECIRIKDLILQNNITDKTARKEHVTSIRERAYNESVMIRNNTCPKCGGQLVQRKSRYGNFLGCSNYPQCKYKLSR